MRREEEAVEIGGFRLLGLLAEGGTARVYRAEGPEGFAALKIFRTPLPEEVVEMAGALMGLEHPHLARIFAVGEDWAAMELLPGPNLEELLDGGKLPVERALPLVTRMAEGLATLHGAGFVHRDLKPSNVIVVDDDHPKIVDFGLARRIGATAGERGFEGSWGYAAPEQIQGHPVDPRSDVYALGIVLYRMLVGHLPFGDAPVAAALGHLHDRPPPPRSLDPTIPPAVEALLLRALAKDPEARFPSMEAFAAALERCAAAVPGRAPTSRRPWYLMAAAAAAFGLIAATLAC